MKTMRLSCESVDFLGISRMIPWEDSMQEQLTMWSDLFQDGTMEELKTLCNAKKVYGLITACENDKCVYQIACENRAGASSDKFEKISIRPSEYMAFNRDINEGTSKEKEYSALYDEVWKEWLPNSGYECKVEPMTHTYVPGYVAIESFDPVNPDAVNSEVEIWVPIEKKN